MWKQRSNRWFVNAPRRLPLRLLQLVTYDVGHFAGNMVFRIEMMRHLVVTCVLLLYPILLARTAYDGTWLYLLELKGCLLALDLTLYVSINYGVWRGRPDVRVAPATVVSYPFYRMFLRLAYVYGHWQCVLWYIPSVAMRTGQLTDGHDEPEGFGVGDLPDWCWQRLLYTARRPKDATAESKEPREEVKILV